MKKMSEIRNSDLADKSVMLCAVLSPLSKLENNEVCAETGTGARLERGRDH